MKKADDILTRLENVELRVNPEADAQVLETIRAAGRAARPAQGKVRRILAEAMTVRLAAAAGVMVTIGVGLFVALSIEPSKRPPAPADPRPSPIGAGCPVLTEPGPGEIRLITNLEATPRSAGAMVQRNARISPMGLVEFGDDRLMWHYRGGTYVTLEKKGQLVYSRVDGGPSTLAGVIVGSPEDLALFDAEGRTGEGLSIWCSIQPPDDLARLACRERITFFQELNPQKLSDLDPLTYLINLEVLYVKNDAQYCEAVADLSPLSNLNHLKVAMFRNFPSLRSLDELSPELAHLDLMRAYKLTDIRALERLTALRSLNLASCIGIRDIAPLAALTALQSLDLFGCNVSDLSPLQGKANLTYLRLFGTKVKDLSPVGSLSGLEKLHMGMCREVTDVTPLGNLRNLRELNLHGCRGITDLSPLEALANLEVLVRPDKRK